MQDFITLGTAPVDETEAQLSQPDYYDTVKHECRQFITLLRRTFGDEPPGVRLAIKSFDHFGMYYEVVCLFDSDNEDAAHHAYRCENELPATWEG